MTPETYSNNIEAVTCFGNNLITLDYGYWIAIKGFTQLNAETHIFNEEKGETIISKLCPTNYCNMNKNV